ncbi:glycosyltransferase family 2 protein [Methylohalobius crimeensis]|uniref:glycosyltransferase family 2 protein n=1 Tax=Methylohalobius crimeensis TaxID=244365 RepID=UPI0003B7B342|nr:glycosyltransferase [Methylohalobius crimeensis]
MFLDRAFAFLYGLDPHRLIEYFWPFLLFDFVRYLGLDLLIVFVYLPRRWWQRTRGRRRALAKLYRLYPLVSIIVPGKNEGEHIPRLAVSLHQQTYGNYELIIVDDGSDDHTETICRRLEREGAIDRFIRNEFRGGKASAANTALAYANGDYIIHIDADSHLDDRSIETILLPFFMDAQVGAVGGDVRVANSKTSLATRLQTIEYMKSISTGRTIASLLGLLRIIAGAHGAFRKDILKRLHGWDVGPGLDGDITLKIRKLGYKVVHEPQAICYTNVPSRFAKLARQRFRWDRSLVRFRLRKHRDLLFPGLRFNFFNFLTVADNVFFNLLLNFKWWAYIAQLLLISPVEDKLVYIVFLNYVFYLGMNIGEYAIAALIYGATMSVRELKVLPYLPLMPFYTGLFMRTVRSYAYLMELIVKSSYYDRWNPWKVSRISKQERM